MRTALVAVLVTVLPGQSWAGKLDLDVHAAPAAPISAHERLTLPKELWAPGSPLGTRGEGFGVQAFSHAGNTSLAALGLAESLGAMGGNKNPAAAAGFGAVTALQLLRGTILWKNRDKVPASQVDFIFLPSR